MVFPSGFLEDPNFTDLSIHGSWSRSSHGLGPFGLRTFTQEMEGVGIGP